MAFLNVTVERKLISNTWFQECRDVIEEITRNNSELPRLMLTADVKQLNIWTVIYKLVNSLAYKLGSGGFESRSGFIFFFFFLLSKPTSLNNVKSPFLYH